MKQAACDHTFVICAYKESEYLEECIQSLENQTVKSKIVLVTSTPNAFIQAHAERHQIPVYSHSGKGIGNNWNFALSAVKTKYATIAHQDDLYCPTYLETCLRLFEQNPDALIAFTDYDEYRNGQPIPKTRNLKIKKWMLTPIKYFKKSIFIRNRVLSLGSPICCPAVSYQMKNLDGFRFSEEMTVSLDWEAWYRIANKRGTFAYCDKPLMYHRIHSASETTNAIGDHRRMTEDQLMFEKFWPKAVAKFILKFYATSQQTNA